MKDYREVTACRLCDSEFLDRVLDLGKTPLANELGGTELDGGGLLDGGAELEGGVLLGSGVGPT